MRQKIILPVINFVMLMLVVLFTTIFAQFLMGNDRLGGKWEIQNNTTYMQRIMAQHTGDDIIEESVSINNFINKSVPMAITKDFISNHLNVSDDNIIDNLYQLEIIKKDLCNKIGLQNNLNVIDNSFLVNHINNDDMDNIIKTVTEIDINVSSCYDYEYIDETLYSVMQNQINYIVELIDMNTYDRINYYLIANQLSNGSFNSNIETDNNAESENQQFTEIIDDPTPLGSSNSSNNNEISYTTYENNYYEYSGNQSIVQYGGFDPNQQYSYNYGYDIVESINGDPTVCNAARYFLSFIPDDYKQRFHERGWHFYVTNWDLNKTFQDSFTNSDVPGYVTGLTYCSNKSIYLVSDINTTWFSAVHEFAHYLDFNNSWLSDKSQLNIDEVSNIYNCVEPNFSVHGYSNHEYFADAFNFYYNPYYVGKMRQYCPNLCNLCDLLTWMDTNCKEREVYINEELLGEPITK